MPTGVAASSRFRSGPLKYFGYALREPLLVGVPLGLGFAWLYRRHRAALPVAVVVAMTAVFAVGPVFGLPLIRRYVETPAVLLTLFYGLAVCGWMLLPPGAARKPLDGRRRSRRGAVCRLPAVARARSSQAVERRIDVDGRMYADLQVAAEAPVVRAAFERCAPLTAADHRPIPFARFWLDGDPGSVTTVEQRGEPDGADAAAPAPQPVHRPRVQAEHVPAREAARRLPADLPQPVLARLRRAGLLVLT